MSEHDEHDVSLPWLEDEPERPTRRGRRLHLLLTASLVPWVVIAALLLRPEGAAEVGPQPVGPAGAPAASQSPSSPPGRAAATPLDEAASSPTPGPNPGPSPGPEPGTATVLSSGGRLTPGPGDAAALAAVAARAWLTEVGPQLAGTASDTEGDGTTYLEHVAVEAVDWPAPGAAVVSLLVVLLDVEDGAYRDVRARRLAVPVRLDADGAAVAGEPWWLPAPDLSADELPAGETVDDPDLLAAAGQALDEAGVAGELVGLERTESWPWLATLQHGDRTQVVWLRPHLGGFAVAGSLPGSAEEPAAEPSATTATDDEARS